ncbi:MAG: sulfotransferase [Nevskia sp.]|nr:sulfotransferase [Nevskia sp.]
MPMEAERRTAPSRIFVVGCPRSGTTVVQATLARLRGVFTVPETHYFTLLLRGLNEWLRNDRAAAAIWRRHMLFVNGRTHRKLCEALAPLAGGKGLPRRLRGRSYIDAFVARMDAAAAARGCTAWVEKTPHHFAYVDVIARHVPDARFVHVVRNCEDVVASIIDGQLRYAGQRAFLGGIAEWSECWNRAVETHLRHAGRPGHLVLRYEDLQREPQQAVERLARFAGVAVAPASAQDRPDIATEPWQRESVMAPLRQPQRKFEELFGPMLQRWLRANLHDYDVVSAELAQLQGQAAPADAAANTRFDLSRSA